MKFSGIETLKNGDRVRFIINGKENTGEVIDINAQGGTVRVEVQSALYKNEKIKMWIPYFLVVKVD